jgi:hypothetical protein
VSKYKIYQNSHATPEFIKANSYLIEEYCDSLAGLPPLEFKGFLEELWRTQFDIKIIKDINQEWEFLIFNNDYDLTLFLLKWKS